MGGMGGINRFTPMAADQRHETDSLPRPASRRKKKGDGKKKASCLAQLGLDDGALLVEAELVEGILVLVAELLEVPIPRRRAY